MRILVTNDDGIDSVGLHVLARAMKPLGDVVIAAPDEEYSGYGAAIGSVWLMKPEVHRTQIEGIDEAWAVTGPPALCAMFARLGAFGDIDLVVSGINPGANVGRAVYHSGTVGACLTARNGGLSAVAVSQAADFSIEGQAMEEILADQQWQGAADVAAVVVEQLLGNLPTQPVVVNLNVPNRPAAEMEGWRRTSIAMGPPRSLATADLVAKPGHEGTFHVEMSWGDVFDATSTENTDTGAVTKGYASISWLGMLEAVEPDAGIAGPAEGALDTFFG
ncbi:MAG: 5'/3'-nucleotidase SurE [Acidimicrobiales bacterium]